MLLGEVVAASAEVAATRSRKAKVGALSTVLGAAAALRGPLDALAVSYASRFALGGLDPLLPDRWPDRRRDDRELRARAVRRLVIE